jgi:hypothetical protein
MADADLLSKIRGEIDARLREVRPLLAEYERLLVAAAALDTVGEDRPASTPTRGRVKQAVRVKRAPTSAPTPTPTPTPTSTPAPESAPAVEPEGSTPAQPRVSTKPRVSAKPASRPSGSAPKRAQRGAAAVAIVAALEHGSHTVSELTIVTAMSGTIIQSNLRRLQQVGTVTRTKRPGDGKAAYALTVAPV